MQSSILVCLFLGSLIGIRAASQDTCSCKPSVFDYSECSLTISGQTCCKSLKVKLDKYPKIKSCTSVEIFWSYPTNNLTLVIKTSATPARQPFRIRLAQQQLNSVISHVYRVVRNQETELKASNDGSSVVRSDSDYRVVVKFQGPSKLMFYGVFIKYDVLKI